MYSQCPECLTRFRVSAAALRAAHGTVRCGRCGSAFDALPRLSDTLQGDGPNSGLGEPVSPGTTGVGGMTGATAAGLLSGSEGGGVPEFHFSADDIEQVFIDARDWQSRFGASSSPGDRAGRMGDTSTAELVGFLKAGETGDEVEPEHDANDPPVWVHEPETVEDITLEGERIQIAGNAGLDGLEELEEDFLEREIEKEIDEQHRAEITGSYRGLRVDEAEVAAEATAADAVEPPHDLDSTDRFEVLRDVPESAFPHDEADQDRTDSSRISVVESTDDAPRTVEVAAPATPPELIAPLEMMPAAVAATAAAIAVESTEALAPQPAEVPPAVAPIAARWRRPAEPETDEAFEIGEHDHRLAEDLAAAASARSWGWAWGIGALVLALALTAQLAHHYRLPLARDATIGPALREVYSRLGRPLPPNWNLAAFELRQWGANESAPTSVGTMTVRASLKNGAAFAQPMPLLRLELEDRFGGTVARRDFQPAEYLKDPAQATRLLPAGTSTEAELAIVGATSEAVGYRLDVCLRDENGVVRCAEPTGASTPSSQAPQ
jgi:predicted Zn finger-like uncharacterized protein